MDSKITTDFDISFTLIENIKVVDHIIHRAVIYSDVKKVTAKEFLIDVFEENNIEYYSLNDDVSWPEAIKQCIELVHKVSGYHKAKMH